MEEKYYELGKILSARLIPAGFTQQPEFKSSLGDSLTFEKGRVRIELSYDRREQELFLKYSVDKKQVDLAYSGNPANISTEFVSKLNTWLDPAFSRKTVTQSQPKKKGCLAALFGIY